MRNVSTPYPAPEYERQDEKSRQSADVNPLFALLPLRVALLQRIEADAEQRRSHLQKRIPFSVLPYAYAERLVFHTQHFRRIAHTHGIVCVRFTLDYKWNDVLASSEAFERFDLVIHIAGTGRVRRADHN